MQDPRKLLGRAVHSTPDAPYLPDESRKAKDKVEAFRLKLSSLKREKFIKASSKKG